MPGHTGKILSEDSSFLSKIEVLPQWQTAAEQFLARPGATLVLGAPDTGKSTFSRYLVHRAYGAGEPVACVDLDLGQSFLGPPTALGLGLYPPRRPEADGLFPEACYFVGQTSPVGAFLEVAVGCRVLADLAARRGAGRLVLNTSGLVQGPLAVRLKRAEVELLNPALIVALERHRELEGLLRALGAAEGGRLLRLPVSSRVLRRSPEERRRFREERFRRYFRQARSLFLPWRTLVWEGLPLGQGRPLGPELLARISLELEVEALYGESQGRRLLLLLEEAPAGHLQPPLPGPEHSWETVHWLSWPSLWWRLAGLLDGSRRTLALGLVLPGSWHPEGLSLWSPLPPAAAGRVRFLKMGKMWLSPEGEELSPE